MSASDSVIETLGRGEKAVLEAGDYAAAVTAFREIERHDTFFAGPILVLDTPAGVAVAEQDPASQRGVLRRVGSLDEARAFVKDRLATYDRMWDGCGCKVDYFGD